MILNGVSQVGTIVNLTKSSTKLRGSLAEPFHRLIYSYGKPILLATSIVSYITLCYANNSGTIRKWKKAYMLW